MLWLQFPHHVHICTIRSAGSNRMMSSIATMIFSDSSDICLSSGPLRSYQIHPVTKKNQTAAELKQVEGHAGENRHLRVLRFHYTSGRVAGEPWQLAPKPHRRSIWAFGLRTWARGKVKFASLVLFLTLNHHLFLPLRKGWREAASFVSGLHFPSVKFNPTTLTLKCVYFLLSRDPFWAPLMRILDKIRCIADIPCFAVSAWTASARAHQWNNRPGVRVIIMSWKKIPRSANTMVQIAHQRINNQQ